MLADAELLILPGTGHLVHYEAVDDAVARIAQFVAPALKTSQETSA